MPRYFEDKTIFEYSWEQVVTAFWKKYPNPNRQLLHLLIVKFVGDYFYIVQFKDHCYSENAFNATANQKTFTHVLTEDTVDREVVNGCLYSQRLITKTNGQVPQWAERFLPKGRVVHILEESVVDPKSRVFITYTRNIGMTNIMTVTEKVVYQDSAEYPGCTEAHRVACIDSQVYGFSRAICAFGVDRFRKNCQKMALGFNHVLQKMFPNHKIHIKSIQQNPIQLKNSNISEIYTNIFQNIQNRKRSDTQ